MSSLVRPLPYWATGGLALRQYAPIPASGASRMRQAQAFGHHTPVTAAAPKVPLPCSMSSAAPRPRWTDSQNSPTKWERRYPAIIRLWTDAWAEFVPFLAFDVEIRKVVCTTNAIESVNARLRRAVRARGHFPTEQAVLKCLYMALMGLDPTGRSRGRWTMRWKAALNAFDVAFDGRLSAGRN
jgi:Transposase, Mutator family